MPTAPKKKVTAVSPKKMTSWFDIKQLPIAEKNITEDKDTVTESLLHSRIDQADLDFSADYMLSLIEKEALLLKDDTQKIFIGGYGEGASVALAAFLKYKGEKPLGGVLGLNGIQALNYTKAVPKFKDSEERKRIETMRKNTPMFLYHGKDDEIIPLHAAVLTYDYLRNIVYRGSHKLEFYVEDNLDHDEDSDKEWWEVGMFLHSLTWNNKVKEAKKEDILPAEPAPEPAAEPAKEEAPAAEAPAAAPADAPAPAADAAPAPTPAAASKMQRHLERMHRHFDIARRMFDDKEMARPHIYEPNTFAQGHQRHHHLHQKSHFQ